MIRVNLLPVKRRKKAKPLPAFIVSTTFITLFVVLVLGYLVYFYSAKLSDVNRQFDGNKHRIEQLKVKIKEVENFEKTNKSFLDKNKLIEKLRKNQNIPAMVLDDISRDLPDGVWLDSMNLKGGDVVLGGYAFSNSSVVKYVENLKTSKIFSDVNLKETSQKDIEKISVYKFVLEFKVTA